ncbi:hypothetical protein GRI97_02580 [Altererythrobacter xixiisoli]|uniref:DUF7079 domain-containing protein n=1 Tax=Croceibacterium xixiisoli TaxID=1476466 RepID=A0A6I4TPP6_9SPHN|nr:hypothetical protein [Croceibacterium xixiisoli]MXO97874.1 hypothetical protein [Croceibacterium xixiisoli]
MLTEAEIDARLPVWTALSDLFLDTELSDAAYRQIASVLRGSGFTPDELRGILEQEVAPAFAANLFSPAGDWAGWTPDSVREVVTASLDRGALCSLSARISRRLLRDHLRTEWLRISPLLEQASGAEPRS